MIGDMIGPHPTSDLDSHSDIEDLVRRFYRAATQDDLLGPMFNDVAQVDWSEHVPKVIAFWSRVLFGVHGYEGDALRAHEVISAKVTLAPAHFERWLDLFGETVDLGWAGPRAERVKQFAADFARVHMAQLNSGAEGCMHRATTDATG
jgi:hemoglobin